MKALSEQSHKCCAGRAAATGLPHSDPNITVSQPKTPKYHLSKGAHPRFCIPRVDNCFYLQPQHSTGGNTSAFFCAAQHHLANVGNCKQSENIPVAKFMLIHVPVVLIVIETFGSASCTHKKTTQALELYISHWLHLPPPRKAVSLCKVTLMLIPMTSHFLGSNDDACTYWCGRTNTPPSPQAHSHYARAS